MKANVSFRFPSKNDCKSSYLEGFQYFKSFWWNFNICFIGLAEDTCFPNLINYLNVTFKKGQSFSLNPSRPDPEWKEKISLKFYFHTFLWCLERFYESLKGAGRVILSYLLTRFERNFCKGFHKLFSSTREVTGNCFHIITQLTFICWK